MSITNKLTYLEDTKTQIKEAIKAKGVEVSDNDTFRSYASKIGDIQTGGSGDCVAGVCFDDIGYTTTPQYMVDGVAYALQIKNTWNASATSRKFTNDLNLVYFPQVDVSNLRDANSMFQDCRLLQCVPSLNISSKLTSMSVMFGGCRSLTSLDLSGWDVSNVTNMGGLFTDCSSLVSINVSGWNTSKVTNISNIVARCESLITLDLSSWDVSKITDMGYIFTTCSSLTTLNLSGWDTSNVTNMSNIINDCTNLEKVDGFLDLTSCNYSDGYSYFTGFYRLEKLRKLTFKNIGYQSAKIGVNFSYITNWGVNNNTITDARQSLIDSLVTYTFDRATAGYTTHTITLSANTKAVLTEEEIAQITAKGYTIA